MLLSHYLDDSVSKNRVTTLQNFRKRLHQNDVTAQEAAILNWNIDVLKRNIEAWSFHEKILADLIFKAVTDESKEGRNKEELRSEIDSLIEQFKAERFNETLQTLSTRIDQYDPTVVDDILNIRVEENNWEEAHTKMNIRRVSCWDSTIIAVKVIGLLSSFIVAFITIYMIYKGHKPGPLILPLYLA